MKRSTRISTFARRVILAAAGVACPSMMVLADDTPAAGANPAAVSAPATPSANAPARPVADAPSPLLGETFEGKSAGISFIAPAGCTRSVRPMSDQVAEYSNPEKEWSLHVTRSSPGQPIPLSNILDKNGKVTSMGIIDVTVDQFKITNPGAAVLRRERINVGPNDCGLVVMRYTQGTQKWLRQQAMLQVNEQLYYIFNFITPAGKVAEGVDENTAPPDPVETTAVETFNAMLDTIKLLDRSDIKADQVGRLYRTRAMFLNWTPNKIRSIVDPLYNGKADKDIEKKQYFLIFRDGQIMGYTFERDLIENRDGRDGVVVYIRTHTEPDKDHTMDLGSNQWMAFDRRGEKWVHALVAHAADPKASKGMAETHSTEVGSMEWETKLAYAPLSGAIDPADAKSFEREGKIPPPKMRPAETHVLDVNLIGKTGNATPIHRDLPPFYLPQAAGHLLARLLLDPRPFEKRTYLFATYVGDNREMMMRYVDVELPRRVAFKGQTVEAVPVVDRIGLDGSPTTHYIMLDGTYLYSENKESKVLIIPTTEEALRARWKDADFSDQSDVPSGPRTSSADPVPPRGLPAAIR